MNTCIDCGISIDNRSLRCRECSGIARSGENNYNYRGVLICPKCGGKKSFYAKICQKCYFKNRNQNEENNPNWKGATICPQCGGEKSYGSQICRQCHSKNIQGENNPSWKGIGGISKNRDLNSFEYATWRLQIFTRDNFTYQHCQKSNKLNAHHIQNFTGNENLQLEVDNGVTLCKKCHQLFHSLFGNKNNNLGQLKWFFENVKLNKRTK